MAKASIIIVAYNAGEWLNKCLQSVVDQTEPDFECFVIDNGSSDKSVENLPPLDDRFTIIDAGENLGFAAANNLAAKKASADWIALLNPDAFARPDWLAQLLKATHISPKVKMVGSLQYMALEPGVLDGLGDFYHASGLAWRAGWGHQAPDHLDDISEAFGPCGAAALYHRETFLRLGGFDERFFCYFEDVDIAYRFRLAGSGCIQMNTAIVDHVSSGISGIASDFAVYHGTRNRFWSFFKNTPAPLFLILGPAHIGMNMAMLLVSMFRPGRFSPTWRGIRHGLKGLPMILKSRKHVHMERNVGLWALLKMFAWSPIPVPKRAVPHIQMTILSDKQRP